MNLKNVLIAGLLLLALSGVINAADVYTGSCHLSCSWSPECAFLTFVNTDVYDTQHYFTAYAHGINGYYGDPPNPCECPYTTTVVVGKGGDSIPDGVLYYIRTGAGDSNISGTFTGDIKCAYDGVYFSSGNSYCCGAVCTGSICVSDEAPVTISGEILCGDDMNVTLYVYNGTAWGKYGYSSDTTYSFDIYNNTTYKLVYSDGEIYEFECIGENIIYNYDLCNYITLHFKDVCDNFLRKTAGTYYNAGAPVSINFYTPSGSYDIIPANQDYLEIWADSAEGTLYYNISNPQNITYVIQNPTISWTNNIFVQDGNTSLPIENALVTFSQDCIINPSSYPSRNKYTGVNGCVNFDQCELDSFALFVGADDYKTFSNMSISSDNMNAFNLSQTVIVKLYPSGDEENETEYDYTDYGTWVVFKDVSGNSTSSILDTDDYVDLYYYNNNSDGKQMTLKFQKYSIADGLINLLSWDIPAGTNGYKRILKSNYTDTLYLYKGYLYNHSINGWDKIKYLSVRNETSEIDLDYQNLSTIVWFRNKNLEGSIDYREDINIIAYANSSYVGLLVISLELYDNGIYETHINLTWTDFIGADYKGFYEWNPMHSYVNGHNYTVRMHGYDYYLLETDYINATDYRKNKLTIGVKDRSGANLNNCYICLEDWGSLPTGSNYYNSYEGMDNGYYRYKASKSGYSGTGWADITLSDGDEIVWYTLTEDYTNASATQQKLSDDDVKGIFFPLMFFLLICLVFGGFKYVSQ